MPDKFIQIDSSGRLAEKASVDTSAGAGDAGKVVALDAAGKINENMMPTGVSAETKVANASEALAENDVVNFWDDTGTLKVRKANATDATKPAHGYVKAAVTEGNPATVYTDGLLPGSGLTIGSRYFLSAATGGAVTATAPTGTGNILQVVGVAISATEIKFEPQDPVIRA